MTDWGEMKRLPGGMIVSGADRDLEVGSGPVLIVLAGEGRWLLGAEVPGVMGLDESARIVAESPRTVDCDDWFDG